MLVSGASVSGLTIAYWLTRYSFDVTVVERAPHLRPGGQALDVRGPALTVAERMGILARLREHSTRLTGFSMVDADGKETHRSEERTLTGGRFESADVEIMRDDLCRVLHAAVGNRVEYLFGDSVASLTQNSSGVDVTFERAASRRFELVVGADGLHSRVRKLAFGPEQQFLRRLGNSYVAVFGMPNFLGLERWEVMYQDEGSDVGAMVMALRKDANARAYVGFTAAEPIEYDHRDIAAQKRLMAARLSSGGWVLPQIVEHMMTAPDFHFDSISQIRMNGWSRGRVVLVGDAGYSVALASGQGTSVAMVGAYVLAGELARHKGDLANGIASYESELRDYVIRNQDIAVKQHEQNAGLQASAAGEPTDEGENSAADDLPDFGALTLPFELKDYEGLVRQS
ncbi:FAD-dependent monooxygenase [Hyalangium versicolor]|uniref:FAD-dependent monooxygenase n=1 Tax=Hyalangium versicolor TaxID=2861190 RepID=UPI001CC9BECD|nr:FAD-dependent monooxygenase [Hyalangium versicolor]